MLDVDVITKCDFFLHNLITDKTFWYLSQFPPASDNISYHIKSEHLEVIRWIAKAEFKIDLKFYKLSMYMTWSLSPFHSGRMEKKIPSGCV